MRVALPIAICSVVISCPVAAQQAGPSFDCFKASTTVEKAICASQDLSMKDLATAKMYKAAVARHPEKKTTLQNSQRTFLRERNACAAAESRQLIGCIDDAYLSRGDALNGPSGGNINVAPFHRGDEDNTAP
jgi:uncharacterized protein